MRIRLRPRADPDSGAPVEAVVSEARALDGFGTDPDATLAWAAAAGRRIIDARPDPATRWELLAELAAIDVAGARILEPHLDALTILDELGDGGALSRTAGAGADATWGVFAAEGPGVRVEATADGRRLNGVKPWCSLAGRLTHALVTAWVDDARRGLFAIDLRHPGVHAHSGPWVARGLERIVSAPVELVEVPAVAVGDPEWYLRRPGFAWGGVGVAAVWYGGAVPLVSTLARAAAREGADQIAAMHVGRADAALWAARAALTAAAAEAAAPERPDARLTAARTRAVVAAAVEEVLSTCDHALGPGPLATDPEHARRVADLRMYVRQQHAERDLARLGAKAGAQWE